MKKKNLKLVAVKEKTSKRKFEERNCISPNCIYSPSFTPTRSNQKYCCEQCQIDTANENARERNRTKYAEEKLLRDYDKRLGRLYKYFLKEEGCQVHIEFIRYEGIDLSKNVSEQQNINTSQPVKWFYEYGTEVHTGNTNWFIVHYRPKK